MAHLILVAEDDPVIGFDLCDTVEEAGYEVQGPHSRSATARSAVQATRPDLAILDATLGDGEVFVLASELDAANVPIIFQSGRDLHEAVRARFPRATTLVKPCPPADMLGAVSSLLEGSLSPGPTL